MSIKAQSLTKQFGAVVAVDELCFEVAPGEIYGLIGPNGCGKTTTMRMLAGVMRPHSGWASIFGHDVVRQENQAKRAVGFHTGTAGLYGRLTPREILTYFGRLYAVPPAQLNDRIKVLGEMMEMDHLLDRRCDQLSTGEKQRVSLARALVHDPPALILDEPTAGLDVLASRFVALLFQRERDRGRAVLFSTHYLTEAELLCDRIGIIHRGRLIKEGTPETIKAAVGASSLEESFLKMIQQGGAP